MLMTPCPDVSTFGESPDISGRKLPPIAPVDYQHLLTHHPKMPDCEACQKAKMQAKPCRRQTSVNEEWKNMDFGKQITADHITTLSEKDESLEGFVVALVILTVELNG